MTDSDFLLSFEDCSLPFEQWDHRAHVRVAYLYASQHDLPSAIDRMRAGVKAYNKATKTPEAIDRGYHETITHAFMQLVHEATVRNGPHNSSEEFCERHPELLDKRVLLKFYSRNRIMSWEAKAEFVKPDIQPLSLDVLTPHPDHLVVFDVDGTLIKSIGVDDRCFSQAVSDVLGVHNISTDWASYKHQTDSGLIFEIASEHLGCPPTEALTQQVRSRFVELLRGEAGDSNFTINEVAGANELLRTLRSHSKWCAAIATGGWEEPAKLKLQLANVGIEGTSFASSDDAMPRIEIIKHAISRAATFHGRNDFEKIVYVGDGSWDAEAARQLGVGFNGVNGDPLAKSFNDTEVPVVRDFSDHLTFIQMLESLSVRYFENGTNG